MRRIIGVVAGLLLMALALPAVAQERTSGAGFRPVYKNPTPGEMPIMVWGGWGINDHLPLTDEWASWLVDAGVNLVYGYMGDVRQKERIFDLADRHGLKVFLQDWYLAVPDTAAAVVSRWRGKKSLAGYMPLDEPTAPDFPKVRRIRDEIFSVDTTRLVLVNLLPMVPPKICKAPSYREYVGESVNQLDLGLLSYDNYPVMLRDGEISVRDTFYENLEIVSSEARRVGWPFWAFGLVIGHYDYAPPVESDLRFEVFNALAYGAQGIQYFCYGYRDPKGFNTTIVPIGKDGERTSIWYGMKNVNAEIQGLKEVFLDCEVIETGHLGEVPKGARQLDRMPGPVSSIKCGRQGVLVSRIRNKDRNYIVIVNHEPRQRQKVRLRFKGNMTRVYSSSKKLPAKSGTYRLDPGGYLVFQY